jgi:hypothetical protein
MTDLEGIQTHDEREEINIIRAGVEPASAVWPSDDEGNGKGSGRSLVSSPEVFKGD